MVLNCPRIWFSRDRHTSSSNWLHSVPKCIEVLRETRNARLIVLETWLFIDFCIRELLMSALRLHDLNVENHDLRFNLLPRSFSECVKMVERIKEVHSKLPRDPQEKSLRLPMGFLFQLKRRDPEFFARFLEMEQEYYREYAPELVTRDPVEASIMDYMPVKSDRVEYSRISTVWLTAVSRINQDWLKSANKLNLARNFAVHSYNSKEALRRMGHHGPNAVDHLRDECLALLKDLIGV